MIKITRLNHTPLIVNSDLIEHIEMTPDTVIALTSGQKYMVLETTEEIIERVVSFPPVPASKSAGSIHVWFRARIRRQVLRWESRRPMAETKPKSRRSSQVEITIGTPGYCQYSWDSWWRSAASSAD